MDNDNQGRKDWQRTDDLKREVLMGVLLFFAIALKLSYAFILIFSK